MTTQHTTARAILALQVRAQDVSYGVWGNCSDLADQLTSGAITPDEATETLRGLESDLAEALDQVDTDSDS